MNDATEREPSSERRAIASQRVLWIDDVRVQTREERILERLFAAVLVVTSVALVVSMAFVG